MSKAPLATSWHSEVAARTRARWHPIRPARLAPSATVSLPVFSDYHKGEIAMVVDFSWSMYDKVDGVRKYVSMREAAVKLIDDLSQKGVNNDVKFGLVPFSESVRVTMPKNYMDGQSSSSNWTKCIEDRKYPYNREATTPSTTNKNEQQDPLGLLRLGSLRRLSELQRDGETAHDRSRRDQGAAQPDVPDRQYAYRSGSRDCLPPPDPQCALHGGCGHGYRGHAEGRHPV